MHNIIIIFKHIVYLIDSNNGQYSLKICKNILKILSIMSYIVYYHKIFQTIQQINKCMTNISRVKWIQNQINGRSEPFDSNKDLKYIFLIKDKKEMQSIIDDTDDLRTMLERKIYENQALTTEIARLKDNQRRDSPDFSKEKDNQIRRNEKEIHERDTIIIKLKRDVEALQRKLKKKEEDLNRQYQIQIEDLQIQQQNDFSDWQTERHNLKKKIEELEQAVSFKNDENLLLVNELQLNNEQLQEMQNHQKLSVELRVKDVKEQMQNNINQLTNQIKQLEDAYGRMKNSQDNNLGEIESILVNKNQLTLKLNDLQATNQHLVVENEGLKQTLLVFQKQRDQDEFHYEELKKKENLHIKRYYETLLEQVERENRSLRVLVEQKNKEIEEVWNTANHSKRF
ncbi:hypothetical protein pb186bvf_010552 [Paramecium bursaria]